jgi:hypothetical protein
MLFEVWVPKTTAAGLYKGTVSVLKGGVEVAKLPLELTVLDMALPDAPTFAFDLLGAASIAAGLTFDALLAPARAERLVAFHAEDSRNPGLREVLGATLKAVWLTPLTTASDQRAIQLTLQALLLGRLMDLAAYEAASPLVRAEASEALRGVQTLLKTPTALSTPDPTVRAHRRWALDELERFLTRPATLRQPSQRLPTPAGDPIGHP